MNEKKIVYAIIGCTAVGKTRLSLELASLLDAEIISVDSRQVYRYMDIGTDKVSPEIRRQIPHHMIDIVDPDEIFSAASFVKMANDAIDRISSRGKLPLIVGGTPMYCRALEGGILSDDLPKDASTRTRLEDRIVAEGSEALHAELAVKDPLSASKIHPNDKVRIIRSLELMELSGMTPSELFADQKKMGGDIEIRYIGLTIDRPTLYSNIERRIREQFAKGYVEEVRWLLDRGHAKDLPSLRGFGYREIVSFLEGDISLEEAIEGDVRSTKAFSRRQSSWFRRFSNVIWYDVSMMSFKEMINASRERIARS